uniref:Uncharacterized protein n=1 Tax=Branchiostoma floridae TaxID=7739 RepID=C3YTA4_BRAFL|eukprot:XP_002600459.1 hypothetical protein BRAFLDRAFT_70167 [Branchiostoma floridae]
MKTVQPNEYEPNASSTPVPESPPVTWHDVVDGTADMIPNPMYCRRAAVVFAMVHHLQARVLKVENQMAELEKTLLGDGPGSDPQRQFLPSGHENAQENPRSAGNPETPAFGLFILLILLASDITKRNKVPYCTNATVMFLNLGPAEYDRE